jgi:hypothetical protein
MIYLLIYGRDDSRIEYLLGLRKSKKITIRRMYKKAKEIDRRIDKLKFNRYSETIKQEIENRRVDSTLKDSIKRRVERLEKSINKSKYGFNEFVKEQAIKDKENFVRAAILELDDKTLGRIMLRMVSEEK